MKYRKRGNELNVGIYLCSGRIRVQAAKLLLRLYVAWGQVRLAGEKTVKIIGKHGPNQPKSSYWNRVADGDPDPRVMIGRMRVAIAVTAKPIIQFSL